MRRPSVLRGAQDAHGDLAAVGDEEGVEPVIEEVTTMRTGVGSKPLHGLLICGQLLTTTSTSRSARRETDRPGRGDAVDDAERAVRVDRHVHVPVDVGDQVALAQAVPAALGEEVLGARVLGPGVVAVAQRVRLLRARAAEGVVPADLVGDDRHERSVLAVAQDRAGGQEHRVLALDRVGCAVAQRGVDGVEHEEVDGLVAAEVDDREHVARVHHGGPGRAGGDDVVEQRARSCDPPGGQVGVGVDEGAAALRRGVPERVGVRRSARPSRRAPPAACS